MGRIRTVKPELLEDEKACALSDAAWRLFVSSWLLADDYGNLRASARYLAAQVWQDTTRDVAPLVDELAAARMWVLYEADGQSYAHVRNWEKHQRIDNRGKPHVPALPEHSRSTPGALAHEHSDTYSDSRGISPRVAESRGGSRLDHDPEGNGKGTEPSGSSARAREEQALSQEPDERRRAILETLALHPAVWLPAQHASIADSVMAGQLAAPKPVDHIRRSIHEAAAKIMATEAGGEHFPPARRATFLVGCVGSLVKQANAGPGTARGGPGDPEAARLSANEAARAAKAAQERRERPREPTPEERKENAASAKAARTALSAVGNGGILRRAVPSAQAPLPPIRSSGDVDAEAAERSRADLARLEAWEAEERKAAGG